jgi:hypothetical protein
MKKNNIIKYSIFLLLVMMIILFLYDNFQKNKEKYTLTDILSNKKYRPTL